MTEETLKHAAGLIPYFLSQNEYSVFVQRRSKDARRNPSVFGLFGGRIEEGETPKQALIREIKEELNIDLTSPVFSLRLVELGVHNYADAYGNTRAYEYALPVTENFAEQVLIGEGDYGIFMTESEIRGNTEFLEGHRQMILDFLDSLKHSQKTSNDHSRN